MLENGGGIILTYYCDWFLDPSVKRLLLHKRHSILRRSYIAPELNSPLSSLTFSADWWSVGALLFHLVTGQVSSNH